MTVLILPIFFCYFFLYTPISSFRIQVVIPLPLVYVFYRSDAANGGCNQTPIHPGEPNNFHTVASPLKFSFEIQIHFFSSDHFFGSEKRGAPHQVSLKQLAGCQATGFFSHISSSIVLRWIYVDSLVGGGACSGPANCFFLEAKPSQIIQKRFNAVHDRWFKIAR